MDFVHKVAIQIIVKVRHFTIPSYSCFLSVTCFISTVLNNVLKFLYTGDHLTVDSLKIFLNTMPLEDRVIMH